ncbi:hypothetical protein I4U23_005267 [Adineta vaga]|nr:hypothetical protein I4U23_005267 [Adineta vaga]
MIKSSTIISAVNYYSTNQICQLFHLNTSSVLVEFNLNSTLIFINQTQTTITYNQITSTTSPENPWKCGNMSTTHNANLGGSNYLNNYSQQTYAQCCNQCLINRNCRGFTWGYPNNTEQWQRYNCWLKATNTPVTALNGFVSAYM